MSNKDFLNIYIYTYIFFSITLIINPMFKICSYMDGTKIRDEDWTVKTHTEF